MIDETSRSLFAIRLICRQLLTKVTRGRYLLKNLVVPYAYIHLKESELPLLPILISSMAEQHQWIPPQFIT